MGIVTIERKGLLVLQQQYDQFSSQFGAFRLSRRVALAAGGAAIAAAAMNVSAQESTPEATPAASPVAGNPVTSSLPNVFGYDAFQFEFLILLGGTFERAADIGECFAGAAQITDGDFNSWCETWIEIGTRLKSIAEEWDQAGHAVSAREAYLRASNYLGEAVFFADGSKDPSQLIPTWELHRACFDAFAARLPFRLKWSRFRMRIRRCQGTCSRSMIPARNDPGSSSTMAATAPLPICGCKVARLRCGADITC